MEESNEKFSSSNLTGFWHYIRQRPQKHTKVPDINSTIKIGEAAPDFDAKDTNGKDVKLKDLKDKIVVLEWTNFDCPYVKKHYGSKNMQRPPKEIHRQRCRSGSLSTRLRQGNKATWQTRQQMWP
jgi:hypothetical protein